MDSVRIQLGFCKGAAGVPRGSSTLPSGCTPSFFMRVEVGFGVRRVKLSLLCNSCPAPTIKAPLDNTYTTFRRNRVGAVHLVLGARLRTRWFAGVRSRRRHTFRAPGVAPGCASHRTAFPGRAQDRPPDCAPGCRPDSASDCSLDCSAVRQTMRQTCASDGALGCGRSGTRPRRRLYTKRCAKLRARLRGQVRANLCTRWHRTLNVGWHTGFSHRIAPVDRVPAFAMVRASIRAAGCSTMIASGCVPDCAPGCAAGCAPGVPPGGPPDDASARKQGGSPAPCTRSSTSLRATRRCYALCTKLCARLCTSLVLRPFEGSPFPGTLRLVASGPAPRPARCTPLQKLLGGNLRPRPAHCSASLPWALCSAACGSSKLFGSASAHPFVAPCDWDPPMV